MKTFKTLGLALLFSSALLAQKAETPDAQYEIGGKINEMMLTEVGTLIVASNDGLVGIKPESKDILFKFTDYGRIKPEEVRFEPQTPYLVIDQAGFGSLKTKKSVIDYLSGEVLFSSEKNNWTQVYMLKIKMPQNKLVIQGQYKDGKKFVNGLGIYDLATGEQVSRTKLKYSEVFQGNPLLMDDGIVMSSNKGTFKLDLKTGQELWKNELKNVSWMITGKDQNTLYTVQTTANRKNSKINKISSGGQVLWPEEHKVKGTVTNFEVTEKGLAVVSDVDNSGKSGLMKLASARSESRIAFLDVNTGADLWEKAPKTKGYAQHFYTMDDGILFGLYSGGINKISYTGNALFKKPLKTGADIITMAQTPQGLIYITSSDCNIVNLETGEQAWKKPLKFKRADHIAVSHDKKNGRYLLSTDRVLHSINENTGEATVLAENKFEGKEDPSDVEIRDNGILRTSDQNMTLLSFDGKELWHTYKRPPGKTAAGAILAGVAAVATAAAAASTANEANYHRNQLGYLNSTGERYAGMAQDWANVSGASIAEMLKKFKATSATKDAQFILTKLDDGVGLVKLDKDTGEVEKEIVLKNRKPVYEVDDRSGVLYYQADNDTIYMYNLNE